MKILRFAAPFLLAAVLRAQSSDVVHLEITADRILNMRTRDVGMSLALAPTGEAALRVRAGRLTVSHAEDDTGAVLTPQTSGKFYTVTVGRADTSRGVTAAEPITLSLLGFAADAAKIKTLSAVLEMVVPDLDPSSVVAVPDLAGKLGAPLASPALANAGVTVVVYDKVTAMAAAAAKAPYGPQEYDSAILFGMAQLPTNIPRPRMEETDIAVGIEDPADHLVSLELQTADGRSLRYNHGGTYHSSGYVGHPGRRFDTYRLLGPLPPGARLVAWLLTPRSLVQLPFHVEGVPLPPPLGHLALGTMTVRLDDAARSTAEARRYRENDPVGAGQPSGLETEAALALAWDDQPRYAALEGANQHLRRPPQLISSVPPEWVEVPANHPPITVRVSFVVDARGDVEAARVLEPGEPPYDEVAVQAVMRWKFRPAEDAAGPTRSFLLVPFVFKAPSWNVAPAPAASRPL